MDKLVDTMMKRPFTTTIVIGSLVGGIVKILGGIADIVKAAKTK